MGNYTKTQINPLPLSYYDQEAPVLARDLVGKLLFTAFDGNICGGRIVETEAYAGAEDRACHAYQMRRTARTEVMFQKGGVAYVYLCYGMHYLFNVVASKENNPHAVLISGLEPLYGQEIMMQRRGLNKIQKNLTNGPGSLAKALGIDKSCNGQSLQGPCIWIEEEQKKDFSIVSSSRINIDYAKEDAKRPWRFYIKGSVWIRSSKS